MGNQQSSRPNSGDSTYSDGSRGKSHRLIYENIPLAFHPIHGTCIKLSDDMVIATRYQSFCNGLCFSNRPVAVDEKISLLCLQCSDAWSGSVRVGFTSWDPGSFDSSLLPRYSCPDLANNSGFWVKALPDNVVVRETQELTFYFNKSGTIFYGFKDEEMVTLLSGVDISRPLWAIIDIYGNTVSMSVKSMNGKKSKPPSREGLPPELLRLSSHQQSPRQSVDNGTSNVARRSASLSVSPQRQPVKSPTLPPLQHFSSVPIVRNISFKSNVYGKNVAITQDGCVAVRAPGEFCNAYVFTSRPVSMGTKVAIQIVSVTGEYRGGLTFGVTSADLSKVNSSNLPSNSDDLLDRSEYWVVNKDVSVNLKKGEELVFSFVQPGAIQITRNNQNTNTLMYVDGSLNLTFFFDLYGSVESIRILGTIGSSQPSVVSLPPEPSANESRQQQPNPNKNIRKMSNVEQLFASRQSGSLPPPLQPTPAAPPTKQPPPVPVRPNKVIGGQKKSPPKLTSSSPKTNTSTPASSPQTSKSDISTKSPSSATIDAFRQNAQNELEVPEGKDDKIVPNECTVCLENSVDCVLYSCGHLCLCFQCAQNVRKSDNLCPICRESIKDVIKVFKC